MRHGQKFNINTPSLRNMMGKAFLGGARRQAVMFMYSMRAQGNKVPYDRLARWVKAHATVKMTHQEWKQYLIKKDVHNPHD